MAFFDKINNFAEQVDDFIKKEIEEKDIRNPIILGKTSLAVKFGINKEKAPYVWSKLQSMGYNISYRYIEPPAKFYKESA